MKDITSILFKVNSSRITPEAGTLMLAEPFLKDTFFTHGVMSVIDYLPEEGATAVVLNNRSEYKLADLLEGVSAESEIPVFCGGPTGQDRLFFVHTLGPDVIGDAREYAPGLYIGGSFDDAIEYVNDGYPTDGAIRFFLGYTNWVEGQLEGEIAKGRWVAVERRLTPEQTLTGAGDAFWHRAVRSLGRDYRSWTLLPRNAVCN
ncbi:MAG: YqgE/AlgH family protein [Muribaculaceae bacterium]|nr:YqgE/AlgH family protein [Muribaculaceae bacterium]